MHIIITLGRNCVGICYPIGHFHNPWGIELVTPEHKTISQLIHNLQQMTSEHVVGGPYKQTSSKKQYVAETKTIMSNKLENKKTLDCKAFFF